MSAASLLNRMKFAWAQVYQHRRDNHELSLDVLRLMRQLNAVGSAESTIPSHLKTEIEEMAETLRKNYECPICLEVISKGELEITSCGHKYCKNCYTALTQNPDCKCAVCRRKLKRNTQAE